MSTKNKALTHNKRRQKAALKSKARVANRPPRTKSQVTNASIAAMAEELFPDADWIFWAAHGVNFLLSSYEEGIWTPMFEGIYEGNPVAPNEIARAIVAKYGAEDETNTWPPEGKAALAWMAQSREVGFIYKMECIHRLKDKNVEDAEIMARLPHNSVVWEVFDELKKKLIQKKSI